MQTLKNFLWVGLGGGIGAILRFLIAVTWKNISFPYSTLFINIIGSLIIGIVFAYSIRPGALPEQLKLFLATGICGGFTTFSSFSLENMQLLRSGNYAAAVMYMLISVTASLLAVFAGFKIMNG